MRVLICGSRGWHDPLPIDTILAGCDVVSDGANEKLVVIHGGARGADTLADTLARGWRAQVIKEEADWDRYGKGAGPVRNKKMLDDHKPDVVYAFRTHGKSNGTDDMCSQAQARGVPVYVITGGDDAATE
jgi:hypothetical protein